MRIWAALLALACLSTPTTEAAEAVRGFVKLTKGQRLYVDYRPAEAGQPTLVLLHGLTYSIASWDPFVRSLDRVHPGLGLLRYDMKGMGRTLLDGPLPVNYEIPHSEQMQQIKALLEHFRLDRVSLLGLSYGGGIGIAFAAAHPQRVENLILMAPFTEPLEDQDRWIRSQVSATRKLNPWNPASDDELYDFFLRQFIYSTYPTAEPVILENPFKLEAVFRMVQGIRKFQATKLTPDLPPRSVHLMVADQDQYIPKAVLDRFWASVPQKQRASRINISYSEHKIPEAIPLFSAAWVARILQHHAETRKGHAFEGSTWNFTARSGSIVIELGTL